MILNVRPVATCLLCLNSLRGLRSIRFMVTWLVTAFTYLHSLLIEEITALHETTLLKVMKDILLNNYGQAARYYPCIA